MGRSHRDRNGDDSAAIVPMPDFAGTSALTSSADPMVAKRSRPCQRKISGGVPRRAAPRMRAAAPRPACVGWAWNAPPLSDTVV